jgi:putative endonuclease
MVVMRDHEKQPCVYMMARAVNGTLYIGVTSDLWTRAMEHREGTFEGFSKKYGVKALVYFEFHPTMDHAIRREKQIKKWNRLWKIRLIEQMNPMWEDLLGADGIIREVGRSGQEFDRGTFGQ